VFYSFQAAWCQCEREETADRINASFQTRAKLGKLLNNSVPYGYKAEDGKMVLHPEEAPIRREVYELFLQHRRKFTVARILNEKGYRTRKGRLWEEIQIKDMLTDSSAKGVYFFNREKRIGSWKSIPKPESEWGRTLYNRWPALAIDDRRKIAETLCEKITIGEGKIRITFTGSPTSEELCKSLTRL